MRVIAGSAKGRKLKSPRGPGTRPILDRVKVALFDILGSLVVGADFLDLFAGTGSVGIEALSRGATRAVFVEATSEAVRVIKENRALTGLADRALVVRQDVFRFLAQIQEQQFDIIYVAPPQYRGLVLRTLYALDSKPILSASGIVVAQWFPKERAPAALRTLELKMERQYGDTLLSFYGNKAAHPEPVH